MPCNTITTSTIDLSKANAEVLKSALINMGFLVSDYSLTSIRAVSKDGAVTVQWSKGMNTTITDNSSNNLDKEVSSKLTQQYSQAALQWAAKKNGWFVKKVADNKFQVIRR